MKVASLYITLKRAAIESDKDKHETLGVEGSPAEEEREHDNN
jgi:hypothetical protein